MRITIETPEGAEPSVQAEPATEGVAAAAPPSELVARAAALGASSAGPAPSEMGAEGPTPFVGQPGAPETTPPDADAAAGLSAGGAPAFATGGLEVDQVEAGEGSDATEDEDTDEES
jgi:hypothetical protein